MREESLNNFLQSRFFAGICIGITLIMSYVGWILFTPSENIASGLVSLTGLNAIDTGSLYAMLGNSALLVASATAMVIINKGFSFIGTITSLFSSLFLLLQSTVLQLSACFNDGSIVVFVTLLCMGMLYMLYENKGNTSLIMLIFVILSAGSMWQSAFLFLIPVFIIGVMQMRAFSFKGMLSICFGIITPYWIALGTGLLSFAQLRFPSIITIFQMESVPLWMFGALGIAIVAVITFGANALTLMKYKLQTRVYNGFILILTLFAIIMMILDTPNAADYFPLLNAGVAMQFAHYYSASKFDKRYIILLLLIAAIIGFYVWQLLYI